VPANYQEEAMSNRLRTPASSTMLLLAAFATAALGVGCGREQAAAPVATEPVPAAAPVAAPPAPEPLTATATLKPAAAGTVAGSITFSEEGDLVTVTAFLTGVTAGTHGFHVHETGDCSDAEFKNAGGHFNPTAAAHGAPTDAAHHAGDLGNIEIAADGTGSLQISTALLTVGPGPNSAVGRAVILHEKADDMKTQPTGDAGGRIACGVIASGPPAEAAAAAPAPGATP
jgi:Cu-Zn family superoxide dismutase